jgi:hypothetical protein
MLSYGVMNPSEVDLNLYSTLIMKLKHNAASEESDEALRLHRLASALDLIHLEWTEHAHSHPRASKMSSAQLQVRTYLLIIYIYIYTYSIIHIHILYVVYVYG